MLPPLRRLTVATAQHDYNGDTLDYCTCYQKSNRRAASDLTHTAHIGPIVHSLPTGPTGSTKLPLDIVCLHLSDYFDHFDNDHEKTTDRSTTPV